MHETRNGLKKHGLATIIILALAAPSLIVAQKVKKYSPQEKLVLAARAWVGPTCKYDGGYRVLTYPGGDPGGDVGVCTDLIVRAYRALGIDLQVLVHEDISKRFAEYPVKKLYDQDKPDKNIDHRRVPNLMAFLREHASSLNTSIEAEGLEQWKAGDVVIFDLLDNGIPSHVGLISDKKSESGRPLVIHHFPPFPTEDDCLPKWKIIGHFRYFPDKKTLDR